MALTMPLGCHQRFRRIAASAMLAAALAFPVHVVSMACAQAAAAAGHVSGPAVAVSGPVHQHGAGTQIAHLHGGDNAVGHTHSHHPAQHHDDADDAAPSQFWSLGCAAAVMPAPEFLAAL